MSNNSLVFTKAQIMKSASRILLFLLLAVLPITLAAQGQTVVGAYMKITQDTHSDYLEIEQAWKKMHQKGIEAGVYNGWQLWRNIHAGFNDPYQYITLQWYDNYEHTFGENAPEGWRKGIYSDGEWENLVQKTFTSRVYAHEEVANLVTMVENAQPAKYLVVYHIRVKPGMNQKYEKMEKEIFKPYFEELIRRGHIAHWGIWSLWPYKEGQARYRAVQGFSDAKTLDAPGVRIEPSELGIDYTMEEIMELTQKTRDIVSVEVWELIDYVSPEE